MQCRKNLDESISASILDVKKEFKALILSSWAQCNNIITF